MNLTHDTSLTKKTGSFDSGMNGLSKDTTPAVKADKPRSGVSKEFHSFLTDIEDLIQSTTSLTGEDLVRVKNQLNEKITAAKASIEAVSGPLVARARETAKVTDGYVHANPWQAVGIGAAFGVLVGLVLARRA